MSDFEKAVRIDRVTKEMVVEAVQWAAQQGMHFPALCHRLGLPDTVGPSIDRLRSEAVRDDEPVRLAAKAVIEWAENTSDPPRCRWCWSTPDNVHETNCVIGRLRAAVEAR